MDYELEKMVLKHFKNVLVVKSNRYSVMLKEMNKNKENKTFVVMKSYFTKLTH